MGSVKVYTHNPCGPLSKNHKIIIAAYNKGLTNIKVTWYPATHHEKHCIGWVLECDQIKWIRIYGNVDTVVQKINGWTWDGKPSEGGKLKY